MTRTPGTDFAQFSDIELSERATLALVAGKMGTFEYFPETDRCVPDKMLCDLWNIPYSTNIGSTIYDNVLNEDLPILHAAVARAIKDGDDYQAAFRIKQKASPPKWIGARGRVVEYNPDGTPKRMVGLNWDITEEKAREERLTHLVHEMNHGVNNAFALVDAMINIGRETAKDLDSFADLMSNQVHALPDAHHLVADFFLHRPGNDDRVHVSAVMNKVLRSWQMGPLGKSISLKLDGDPTLNPHDISALSMILYAMATNAEKHSVLGAHPGTLSIYIKVLTDATYRLEWHEILDTPRQNPTSQNDNDQFGAILTQHSLAKLKAQQVERTLDKTGLRFAATFPAQG